MFSFKSSQEFVYFCIGQFDSNNYKKCETIKMLFF